MAININIPIENAVTDGSLNPVTSNAVFDAINGLIPTHDGVTYDTNAIQTLTAAEYAAITPNASTLYFIV